MIFVSGLDTIERVQGIRDNAMDVIAKIMVTSEWTSEGNSFQKQKVMNLNVLIEECNIFLKRELLNRPKASRTTTFLYR